MDFEGNRQYAKFSSFRVAAEEEQYQLGLGAFVEGNAGVCVRWPRSGLRGATGRRERPLRGLTASPRAGGPPSEPRPLRSVNATSATQVSVPRHR